MRKSLVASTTALAAFMIGQAFAADLPANPVYAPPPPVVVPVFSWTGFYLGGNLGGAWGQGHVTDSLHGLSFDRGSNGVFIGGAQLGFNYQFAYSNFVLGFEWDFDWAAKNSHTSAAIVGPGGDLFTVSSNKSWITTLAARFGVAYNRLLFYGKAGGGWISNNNFTVADLTTGASISFSNNNTDSGWLLGAGMEWAFAYNWTARLEYDYLGLSRRTFITPAGALVLPGDTFTIGNRNVQMVTVGVNYLFNWGSPVRY